MFVRAAKGEMPIAADTRWMSAGLGNESSVSERSEYSVINAAPVE
jgi:hypothetical protein